MISIGHRMRSTGSTFDKIPQSLPSAFRTLRQLWKTKFLSNMLSTCVWSAGKGAEITNLRAAEEGLSNMLSSCTKSDPGIIRQDVEVGRGNSSGQAKKPQAVPAPFRSRCRWEISFLSNMLQACVWSAGNGADRAVEESPLSLRTVNYGGVVVLPAMNS